MIKSFIKTKNLWEIHQLNKFKMIIKLDLKVIQIYQS